MSYLECGVIATAKKENERRVAIHPGHFERIPDGLRSHMTFESGYGEPFALPDEGIRGLGFSTASRDDIMERSELVILPKPLTEDLGQLKRGAFHWGWPHCVQQREITQTAIDRRLTLLAWEAMFAWGRTGDRQLHTFYKNNEMAGYCGVLHALELAGWDGVYGPPRRAVVLGFGSVSRGAVYALQGRGLHETVVLTQRPAHLVRDQLPGCRHGQMTGDGRDEPMAARLPDGSELPLPKLLAGADLIVNGTLQDTDAPLMYLGEGDEGRLAPGAVIVDVSCDEGMGFPFARPTSFEEPAFKIGRGALYYAVDHTPTYLWNSASWEISQALLPYLERVMSGREAWAEDDTLERAVEIDAGVIRNPKVLSFQGRSPDYPHPVE